MLTDDEIAGMRATQESALPDVCTIKRVSTAPDSHGGSTESEIYLLNRPCRFKPLKGGEEVFSGVFAESGDCMVTLVHNQAIDELDKINFENVDYEVCHIEDSQSWTTAKRVMVRRVKP